MSLSMFPSCNTTLLLRIMDMLVICAWPMTTQTNSEIHFKCVRCRRNDCEASSAGPQEGISAFCARHGIEREYSEHKRALKRNEMLWILLLFDSSVLADSRQITKSPCLVLISVKEGWPQ